MLQIFQLSFHGGAPVFQVNQRLLFRGFFLRSRNQRFQTTPRAIAADKATRRTKALNNSGPGCDGLNRRRGRPGRGGRLSPSQQTGEEVTGGEAFRSKGLFETSLEVLKVGFVFLDFLLQFSRHFQGRI